jgi:hypothetical protein
MSQLAPSNPAAALTPAEARSLLIDAVRRDMYGPTGPDDTTWPAAEPRVVNPNETFAEPREARGVFVDSDGNEVLRGSPLRRYGIGVLFPQGLTRPQEKTLDDVQADTAHDAEASDPDGVTAVEPAPPADDSPTGHADADDAGEVDSEPWRPRSMAVSFLVEGRGGSDATLQIEVTGGRYEPFPVQVGGSAANFWRRRSISLTATAPAASDHNAVHRLTDGVLQLEVGVTYRPHETGTIVTVYVLNRTPAGIDLAMATVASLFQAQLQVSARAGLVADYPTRDVFEGEDRSLDLLYHRYPVQAVGHGCNARVADEAERTTVIGQHFPVEVVRSPVPDAVDSDNNPLRVDMDDLGSWTQGARAQVDAILAAYQAWIGRRRADLASLPARLQDAARAHLDSCQGFLDDATDGWRLAQADAEVQKVLRWTSAAMADQRRAYAATIRPLEFNQVGKVVGAAGPSPHDPAQRSPARWRAFQIAFLLACLPGVANPDDPRADIVDIIWMPTGGGKTEAYSAVAAFTMLWRRYHQVRKDQLRGTQGTTVLMRYTLRLLTAQQLQRAAALICALEQIRRAHPGELGDRRKFTIGAWLGARSTPNDWSSARTALREWKSNANQRGFLLTRCPWCAAQIGRRPGAGQQAIDGYRLTPAPDSTEQRVMAYCPNPECPFNDDHQAAAGERPSGLPVYEVDTDLYRQPPTFIVGTIDKFAMLAWRTEAARFFGIEAGRRAGPGPALLIQDELHLISGPLGSLDALYEPIIDDLCQRDGGARPRIIAATATTRRYVEQTRALYGRDRTRLIPPPGLDAGDNFFSRTNETSSGKIFVGISAPGFGKAQEAQIRLVAALSHAAGSLDAAGHPADPWWTNLCFFSSRRSLGLVQSLCQTHLRGLTWRLHQATGVAAGPPRQKTGSRLAQRSMVARVELTAQATADVSEAMQRLEIAYTDKGCADLCFATSMIEVGVDIDRLGLLTMFGQPKSSSQYIQVAGRVGRSEESAPGVVFVVLSPFNNRDRSHFEQFSTFHQRLYASVEPVSITPFTPAALERGLAGALTSWLRNAADPATPADAVAHLDAAVAPLTARTESGSPQRQNLERQTAELRDQLEATTHTGWGVLRPTQPTGGFLRPLGDQPTGEHDPDALTTHWLVPTSMRSVDAEAGARTVYHTRTAEAGPAAQPGGAAPGTDDEDLI